MAKKHDDIVSAKTFFLNEQHELTPNEVSGGGGWAKLAPINWEDRAKIVSHSLQRTQKKIDDSHDPLRGQRYFILAEPVAAIKKESENKRKAPEGTYLDKPDYASSDYSRVFQRLGIDLLQVTDDGAAIVHANQQRLHQLIQTSSSLDKVGRREQSRWASIQSFKTIPSRLRTDLSWLKTLAKEEPADVVFELQPLLSRLEGERVLDAIIQHLDDSYGEKLTGTGTDYSGRMWYRGVASKRSIRQISRDFYSLQSVHPPQYSVAATASRNSRTRHSKKLKIRPTNVDNQDSLPIVAVVDNGVPHDHPYLAQYRRGQYNSPLVQRRHIGDHGSWVASRVVFGDPNTYDDASSIKGSCQYYDVNVAVSSHSFDDKSVVEAMRAVVATAPDVRVFNLSFDSQRPLDQFDKVQRHERLVSVQDLDNFLFANDVLAVVAAGNSPRGLVPNIPYPNHYDEPEWAMGHWSRSFNSLTCGSIVKNLRPNGLVRQLDWPSPFTRCGPGLCQSPKPDFVSNGGNVTPEYTFATGLGVWCCNARGLWEDQTGTSFSAPLLAREAAFALKELGQYCVQGTAPFAVTAKAYLALTAINPVTNSNIDDLVSRASGRGQTTVDGLRSPNPNKAIMVWQGVIEGPKESIRVQLPIPTEWLKEASSPYLRVVVASNPPVNAAAHNVWACRRINARLRPAPEAKAVRPNNRSHKGYPLFEHYYNLTRYIKKVDEIGSLWIMEISYDQIADYYPAIEFSPQQKVAFAAELCDDSEIPSSPQQWLQAMPINATMNRLSIPSVHIKTPVIVRV